MADQPKKSFPEPSLSVSELSKALYETNRRLTDTIRERNELFSNISHDLRAPVTAIANAVEYLESLDHISGEDVRDVLPLISTRTKALSSMIDNVFQLVTFDSGPVSLQTESVPAAAFLEDYYYLCEADARFSGRQLILDIPDISCGNIQIDFAYMQRVLDNLTANALKFTKDNGEIRFALSKPDEQTVRITVSDNGCGIKPADLPRVFERTYMAEDARTPGAMQGAGLGLSICREIVERHGGRIFCESDGKTGTAFHIDLPTAS